MNQNLRKSYEWYDFLQRDQTCHKKISASIKKPAIPASK